MFNKIKVLQQFEKSLITSKYLTQVNMWLPIFVLALSTSVWAQEKPVIDPSLLVDLFGPPPNASSTTPDPGAAEFFGSDGKGAGDCICVPYHNCDENSVLKLDGQSDGFGIIDIRFGKNKCDHFLDLCCTYPENPVGPVNPVDPVYPPVDPINPPVDPVRPPVTTERPRPPITAPPTLPPAEKIKCGIRNEQGVEFHIQGNNDREAEYGEFPWMVAILRRNWIPSSTENLALCGGSLIHPQVVLTGAHCLTKLAPSDIKIRAGEWDTQTTKERYPYQEQNVDKFIIHPEFNDQILLNDFALLILSSPVTYAANVKPICLPEQGHVYDQRECYASGWGKKTFGKQGSPSVILKKIDLPIVPKDKCESALRKTRLGKHFELHHSFICAGGIGGKDTCTGDGGSPLVCPDKNNPGRYTQAGMVAWGIGCGDDNVPGVYANVPGFRNWIDHQMTLHNFDISSYTV